MKFEESEQKLWQTYRTAKAPPYLWTRVLAAIEAREAALKDLWWNQLGWMGRLTAAATVAVGFALLFTFRQASENVDPLLEATTSQSSYVQLASLPAGEFVPANGDVSRLNGESDDAIILTGGDVQ